MTSRQRWHLLTTSILVCTSSRRHSRQSSLICVHPFHLGIVTMTPHAPFAIPSSDSYLSDHTEHTNNDFDVIGKISLFARILGGHCGLSTAERNPAIIYRSACEDRSEVLPESDCSASNPTYLSATDDKLAGYSIISRPFTASMTSVTFPLRSLILVCGCSDTLVQIFVRSTPLVLVPRQWTRDILSSFAL